MKKYFTIHCGEDGDWFFGTFNTKEEAIEDCLECGEVEFLEELPKWGDDFYWSDKRKYIIIEGEVKVPKPKKVVTEYDFD